MDSVFWGIHPIGLNWVIVGTSVSCLSIFTELFCPYNNCSLWFYAAGPLACYQQPVGNLRMATPRLESSPSNCATPGETPRSPGTTTAHSRFSRNSFDLICHWPKDDEFTSRIWMMEQ